MDTTTLIALGIPGLILAIGYAIKQLSAALFVREEAMKKRAEAVLVRAETAKIEADADTTGAHTLDRTVSGREADAATIRNVIEELRARLDRCEARHDTQEKRHASERDEWRKAIHAKDAQIDALWAEVRSLRTAIEGNRA